MAVLLPCKRLNRRSLAWGNRGRRGSKSIGSRKGEAAGAGPTAARRGAGALRLQLRAPQNASTVHRGIRISVTPAPRRAGGRGGG